MRLLSMLKIFLKDSGFVIYIYVSKSSFPSQERKKLWRKQIAYEFSLKGKQHVVARKIKVALKQSN